MKKSIFLLLFSCMLWSSAQSTLHHCYRITFTDKLQSPYSTQHPDAYLSQRALDKRARFNIPITAEDLPVSPLYIENILGIYPDVELLSKSKWTNSIAVLCDRDSCVQQWEQFSCVARIDTIGYISRLYEDETTQKVEKVAPKSYLLSNDYGAAYTQIAMHNGHLLHDAGYRGEGMLIAVIDGGWQGFNENPSVQHLYENQQIVGTYSFYNQNIYQPDGAISHGAQVTSVMAITAHEQMVGTAPAAHYFFICSEMPFELQIEEDFLAQAIEMADSIGADVVNISLGYTTYIYEPFFDLSSIDGRSQISSIVASKAASKGMLLCVAAGNMGGSDWRYISRPADAEHVLTIGAVQSDSTLAYFSSVGPTYDGRIKPDVVALGYGAAIGVTPWDEVEYGSGTSFAAPIIAGLSACLWQALPEKSPMELMQIIRDNGHKADNPDNYLGCGLPDFYRAYLLHREESGLWAGNRGEKPILFPNPCSDYFIVQSEESVSRYEVVDLFGRRVASGLCSGEKAFRVDMRSQPAGIYFLLLEQDSHQQQVLKVVKK